MASVNQSTTFLPSVSPSSLGGNSSAYQEKMNGGAQQQQQRGGQGYGYEGKMIAPGVAEVSSYKGGKRRQSKRRQSKRRQSKRRQNKSRKQRK